MYETSNHSNGCENKYQKFLPFLWCQGKSDKYLSTRFEIYCFWGFTTSIQRFMAAMYQLVNLMGLHWRGHTFQGCRNRGGDLGVFAPPPPPDFSRSVKPISTMGQIIPTILLLTPPLRIFNPSYGPEFICTSRKMHFVFTRYNSLKLILNENSYFCLCSIKFLVNVS